MLYIGTRSRYWQWPFRRTWDQFLRSLLFKNCLLHLRRIRDFSHFRTQLNLDENLVGCRNGGSHRGRGPKRFRFSVFCIGSRNFVSKEFSSHRKKLYLAGKVLPPIRNVIFTLSNIIDEIPIPWSQFAGMYLSLSVRADVLLCESFSFSKSIEKTRSRFLVLSLVFSKLWHCQVLLLFD